MPSNITISNHGSGPQNVATGDGPQNNNNAGGLQINSGSFSGRKDSTIKEKNSLLTR